MNKKYIKPAAKDLNEVEMALGGCTSGHGVPEACLNGFSDGYSCNTGGNFQPGHNAPSCSANGLYAVACSNGGGAG